MDIHDFFSSYAGMYATQVFLHSLVAAVMAERALGAWRLNGPAIRQRFHLIAVLAPVAAFPLYQLINPERGSMYFRVEALLDSTRWTALRPWGAFPLGSLFLIALGITSLVFLLQELIPIIKHSLESRRSEMEWDRADEDPRVQEALASIGQERSAVYVVSDEEPFIYSTTGTSPAVFLSSALLVSFGPRELAAALAHEAAHIQRSRKPLLILTYLVRLLTFFNPVTLVEFRRVVQDEEKICDTKAIELTGAPEALASALEKFRAAEAGARQEEQDGKGLGDIPRSIRNYSHDFMLEGRIQRLRAGEERAGADSGEWARFGITLVLIITINYFIV